jgi:hypothetical protein
MQGRVLHGDGALGEPEICLAVLAKKESNLKAKLLLSEIHRERRGACNGKGKDENADAQPG